MTYDIHPCLFAPRKQVITLARQRSRTERSMNDAHNCPKKLTKIHIQITYTLKFKTKINYTS